MTPARRIRVIVGLILLALFLAPLLSSGVDLLVDWLWFGQEGFRIIYLTTLKAEIGLSSLASLFFILVVGLNLYLARAVSRSYGYHVYSQMIDFPALDRFANLIRAAIAGVVLLLGYAVGEWASDHWLQYLLWRKGPAIGQADPLFGIDIGFYLFRLPFQWFVFHLALVTLLISLAGATFLYFLEGGVTAIQRRGFSIAAGARRHLMILLGCLFLLLAWRARLALYNLLFSARGLIFGASYTDVHATLPVLWIVLALCVITALALFLGARSRSWRPAFWSLGALGVVWVLGLGIYPEIVQRFIVTPNEIDRERPYIARAIEFTRKAYGLDRFEEREFSAVEDLTQADVQQNAATIRNVRLWDHQPLKTTFGQLQEIRTYYDFNSVDNDRYWINGVYRQVSLSPRELNATSLPSRNWINEHLTYTHGYGLCLGPVNESTPDGLPVLFIKDIPPVSNIPLRINRPEIYFGELQNDYCFVDTRLKEFDYPSGDQNIYTRYAGAGGIPVESVWRRLLFALKFGDKNIFFSTDIDSSSRLMIYRQVLDRASRLTPFLAYDSDPYLVINSQGELYWMLDGYTTSDRYPYSDPSGDMGNYIRNSVKATVNAYTGEVRFYIADPTDPIIQAYSDLFPGVFQPLSSMPEDLRAHIRYPEQFFSIQAAKYALFHMTDPRVFYNREDLWRVAKSAARGSDQPMTPYYTIMKLPEVGKQEEFILMVPFTPARKDNMIAWMAARCDAPDYGKVLVFTFPKQKLVYGPQQIESRIDQDPVISPQLSLWDQHGSQVIRGTLLVIPVRNSVLYVEPLYLSAQGGGGLPQLKRVIVSYSDRVVMEDSLEDALKRIFGNESEAAPSAPGAAPTPAAAPAAAAANVQALAREANQHYLRALELLRQGDWAGYGDEIKKLGDVLKQMSPQ